ncbi:MAG: hypothetical protein MSH12_12735 [Romboutsia timonensis]|nr:hypothetical protein [Romboutsia timonensis]
MNIFSNNFTKEDSILLNSVLYLADKSNVHIDKTKVFEEIKERNLILNLDNTKNILHIYSKSNNDFSIKINNTTVNDLKSARAVASLRYSVNSINKK